VLTATELAAMSDVADASMMDTCVIQTATVTYDAVGGAVETWSNSASTPCGVRFTSERRAETIEVAGVRYDVDATIRVSLDTTVSTLQRIRVTHRAGTALTTAWTFEVLGVVRRGHTANVLKVRYVA